VERFNVRYSMGSLVSLPFLEIDKTSQKLASSEHYRHSISDEEIKFCNIDTNRIELLLFSANISWFLGYILQILFREKSQNCQ
jgi:hypothetical protein